MVSRVLWYLFWQSIYIFHFIRKVRELIDHPSYGTCADNKQLCCYFQNFETKISLIDSDPFCVSPHKPRREKTCFCHMRRTKAPLLFAARIV